MSRKNRSGIFPPDQEQRDRIVDDLDRNMLVEAAAGTGKTTSMVERMVALLAKGTCEEHPQPGRGDVHPESGCRAAGAVPDQAGKGGP